MSNKELRPGFPTGLIAAKRSEFTAGLDTVGVLNEGLIEHGPDAIMTVPSNTFGDDQAEPSSLRYNDDTDEFEGAYADGWRVLGGAAGRWETTPVAPSLAAAASRGYLIDNRTAVSAVVLPVPSKVGQAVSVADLFGVFGQFPLTIKGNGKKVYGATDDMVISTNSCAATFTWTGEDRGWIITQAVGLGQGMVYNRVVFEQDITALTTNVTLDYPAAMIDVYVGGLRLRSDSFTIINDTSVTFTPGLTNTHLMIVEYTPIKIADNAFGERIGDLEQRMTLTEGNVTDFSNKTDPLKGANLVGFKRKKLIQFMDTAQKALDAQSVSIWEFANLITNKPTSDPQTWDWSPALQGLSNYCLSYVSQTAVNAAMYGAKEGYLTPGIFPLYSTVNATRYLSSNGSLQTVFRLRGAGRTSSILQPMTPGMTGIIATNCSIILEDLGMRSGAANQISYQLGLPDVWAPVAHAVFNRFGTSGFLNNGLVYLCFDSSFIDCFWQNIQGASDLSGSYGVRFATYTGPQNGGTTGDGSGDGSNQIVFVRPTIETSADDSILISFEGKSGAYPTHSITCYGGHLETHNLKSKLFNIYNCRYIAFHDVTFSQNGVSTGIVSMFRAGYIENSQNILFDHCHATTTNRLAAVNGADTKMIKITGTCQNVNFRDCHFLGPYQDINASKHNLDLLIDYSTASLGKKSFDVTNAVCGDNQSREITSRMRVGSLSGTHDYRFDVDETTGAVTVFYSTNVTDVPDGTALWQVTAAGIMKTAVNIQVGALSSTGATRGVDFVTNGDGTTVVASARADNIGRLYLTSVSGAQSWVMGSVAFNPVTSATFTLGTSAAYPSNIYSQNAVTVVSDANYKDEVKPITGEEEYDKLVAAIGSVPYSAWKLKSAIAQKGSANARWHVGVIAQQVRDAISAAGLDWTHYGLITFESHSQVVTEGEDGFYYPVVDESEMSTIPMTKEGYIDPITGADSVVIEDDVITYTREIYMLRMEEFMVLRMAYIESRI